MLEQTLLHEIIHAYTFLDKDLFQSSSLSLEENRLISNTLLTHSFPNIIAQVYAENRAEVMANMLYIKYNQDNTELIESVLNKLYKTEDEKTQKNIALNKINSHILLSEIDKETIENIEQLKSDLKVLDNNEILEYSKMFAADKTIDFIKLFGSNIDVSKIYSEGTIKKALEESIIDKLYYPDNIKNNYKQIDLEAQRIIDNYPELLDKYNYYLKIDEQKIPLTKLKKINFDGIYKPSLILQNKFSRKENLLQDIEISSIKIYNNNEFKNIIQIIEDIKNTLSTKKKNK